MQEQTATNPQTGEKIVFRGGQWQPMSAPAPGVIMGRPKAVDPYKAEDQQFQRAANVRAEEDQRRQIEKDRLTVESGRLALERDQAKFNATGGIDTTGEEKTAAFLTTRMVNANAAIKRALALDDEAQAPGILETGASFFGENARGFAQSAPRQQVYAAQLDLIDAALTLGTGAAYTAEQKESIGRTLTPQLTDSPSTIAEKRRRLLEYLEAGRVKSGAASGEIDKAVAAVNQMYGDKSQEPDLGLEVSFNTTPIAEWQGKIDPEFAGNVSHVYTDLDGNVTGYELIDDPSGVGSIMFIDTPVDKGPGPQTPPDDGLGQAFMSGVGDLVEGAGDVIGLVNNPLNAGINALFGTSLSTDLGRSAREATGIPRGNQYAEAINKGGMSALTGTGVANALARSAPMAGNAVVNALAQQPVQQVAGGMAAGASSEGAQRAGGGPVVQALAGLAGGVGGFKAADKIAGIGRAAPNALASAAGRQNVDLLPADAGGNFIRRMTSGAAQSPIAAPPISEAVTKQAGQFKDAVGSASIGTRMDYDDAGKMVAQAGQRYVAQSSKKGSALYDRAEKRAAGVSIKPQGAIRAIDEQIAELSQAANTNRPLISVLESLKADLATRGGVRVKGMRDMRTSASSAAYSKDLRSTPAKRVLKIVADAIGGDIDAGLTQAGRADAAAAFKTADKYWADRVQYIDNILEPVIGGKKSGESVLRAVQGMAEGKGGGASNLSGLMRSLDKKEAADIQATIIDRAGRAKSGAQDAEGEAYSAATFLTNWNNMTPKGKAILFPEANVRRNLDDIAKIAEGTKRAQSFNNTSNTGGALAAQALLTGGGAFAGGLPGFLLTTGGQYLTGKLLANPSFAKWLATTAKAPAPVAVKRLDAIAASNPIIANDIASVKRFISEMPASPTTAAAETNDIEN